MRHVPDGPERRKLMRNAVVQATETGEGFYFVGFDWTSHFCVTGARSTQQALFFARVFAPYICWRAIIHIQKDDDYYTAVILSIGGHPEPYGLKVSISGPKSKGFWITPDPLRVWELLELLPPT